MFTSECLQKIYFDGFKEVIKERKIGGEWELLLVNPDGTMGMTSKIWPQLVKLGWKAIYEKRKIVACVDPGTGWRCETDAGLGTLEVVTDPVTNLCQMAEKEGPIIRDLKLAAEEAGMLLIGLGIQPLTKPAEKKWQKKPRYDAIRPLLPGVDVVTVTASCQTQIEITRDEVVPLFRFMNYLSGPMLALTANAAIWQGGIDRSRVAVREDVWSSSVDFTGMRSGILPWFHNEKDMAYHFVNLPFIIFEDKWNGGSIKPCQETFQYFIANNFDYLKEQDIRELFYEHEKYIWSVVRPRTKFGTLEVRPNCQTPPWISRTSVHAMHLGLIENREKADALARRFMHSEWIGMRREFIERGVDGIYGNFPLIYVVRDMLRIAEEGLKKRGKGEERLLFELKNIAFKGTHPPYRVAKDEFLKGGITALIEAFRF